GVAGVEEAAERTEGAAAPGGVVALVEPLGSEAVLAEEGERFAEFGRFAGVIGEEAGRDSAVGGEGVDALAAEVGEVVLGPSPEEAGAVAAEEADGGGVVVRGAAHEEAGVAGGSAGAGRAAVEDLDVQAAALESGGRGDAADAGADDDGVGPELVGGEGAVPVADGHGGSLRRPKRHVPRGAGHTPATPRHVSRERRRQEERTVAAATAVSASGARVLMPEERGFGVAGAEIGWSGWRAGEGVAGRGRRRVAA